MDRYEALMQDMSRFKEHFIKCDYYGAETCEECPANKGKSCGANQETVLRDIVSRIDGILRSNDVEKETK